MKKTKIFLIILAILIAVLSILVWWQFDNIKSAYYSLKYDRENLEELMVEQKENVSKAIKENGNYNVRPSTESEEKLHREELINDDEFVGILTGKTSVEEMFGKEIELDENKNFIDKEGAGVTKEELKSNKTETLPPPNTEPAQPTVTKEAADEKAAECIARMYVLKSSFESQLDALFWEARAYYYSLSDADKKNAKTILISKYYSRITALESKCDSDVEAVLSELAGVLDKVNQDKTIVDKIRQAYKEEKNLKKAYYIARLT